MNKYEAMFILKPNLSEAEKKALLDQINDAIVKNNASVAKANIWSERRKLFFPIKKQQEGIYYLVNFTAPPEGIAKIRHAYKLNENILRVLITVAK
jgi:small subunit ribosomal protein S6